MKVALMLFALTLPLFAQRQMEDLGRGVIAMRTGNGSTYVGWRMLGSDTGDVAFNLYRSVNGGTAVRLNGSPLTATTDYQDNPGSGTLNGSSLTYFVRPVVGGIEQAASTGYVLPAGSPTGRHFEVPFTTDPGPDGPYDTKFAWVGDFDGDGEYDFLCDRLSTLGAHEQFLEAYLRDGTFLWRMHMGPTSAIQSDIYRPGAAAISTGDGDNVTCFDLDGDNMAEAIVRTANGVSVTNAAGNTVTSITAPNDSDQFLTVIDGMTGVEIDSAPMPNSWSQHGTLQSKCFIAYLDGKRPSIILYGYNRASSGAFYRQWTAWDFVGGELVQRWTWAQSPSMPGAEGHQVRIADVDNDGRDELIDIGHVMDDDGSQLYVTELTHGDRFHVADIHPLRPGLETFAIQQNNPSFLATAYMNASDGAMHDKWYASGLVDVGRGLTADIAPAHLGMEMFSTQPNVYNADGDVISANHPFPYEGLWWDGDRGREFIAGANGTGTSPIIDKFNPATGGNTRLHSIYNDGVHNAYGGRPAFWGDIFGDWREELVLVRNDYSGLRVFTTTTPAEDRRRTLMHNAQYRVQTTTKGYVQASYTDYYLGFESDEDPPPPIDDTDHTWTGTTPTFDATTCPPGESILFDLSGNNAAPVVLTGPLAPSFLKVFSPTDYTFDATLGSLTGTMRMMKSGAGSLVLGGSHSFTGTTSVWDGALVVNGTIAASPVTVHGGIWGGPLARGETGGRLSGSGSIDRPVTLAWRGAIAPGAGNGDAATLSLNAGLTCGADTVISLDLSNSSASDLVAITGDLVLDGPTTFVIHPLEAQLEPGTHTLVSYTGSFTGSLDDFTVDLPAGTPHSLADTGNGIRLTIPVTRTPGSIAWRGGQNGNTWDLFETENFLLDGSPESFVSGDAVSFDDSGSPHTGVVLEGELHTGGVTVASSLDYTFSGSGTLSGTGGLAKSGTGTLATGGGHGFTGPVAVTGGTLSVTELADAGLPSSIGAGGVSPTNLVLDGGTIRHDGTQTGTDRGIRLGSGGGTLSTPDESLRIGGTIDGTGSLTKAGGGLLIVGGANSYSGGTFIDAGTLQLASDTANASGLGSGAVTFRGGTLSMTDNTSSYNTANYQLVVPAGESGRFNADGRCYLGGTLTGAGTLTFHTPFVRTDLRANWSGFTGTLRVVTDGDGGDFRIDNTFGYGNASLDLGEGVYAYYMPSMGSNLTLDIGALSGPADATLLGGPTSGRTLTWRIGGKNTDSTYEGATDEQNESSQTAIQKIGSGILTFSGTLAHRGNTTVTAGTLRLEGSSAASNFTVASGGTLGGAGTLDGQLSLLNSATLELGPSPLAVVGNISASGGVTVRPVGDPGTGTHIVATYTGSLLGSPEFSWAGPPTHDAAFSATNGQITVTLTPASVDSDGDLIDDAWELSHYPSVASAAPLDDTDGDGFNTWTEWKAGTDPTLDSSFPGTPVTGETSLEPVADTFIFHRDGGYAYNGQNFGSSGELDLYQFGGGIYSFAYIRFDLSVLPAGATVDSAEIEFTKVANTNEGVHDARNDNLVSSRFGLWGLLDAEGNTPQDWSESGLTADEVGAELASGTNPQFDTSMPRTVSFDEVGETVTSTGAMVAGESGGAFAAFLQQRFDAGGGATLIADIPDDASSGGRGYALGSREADAGSRPVLRISYSAGAPLPDPDEDDDGLEDAWEAHHFGTLAVTGDDDGDGDGSPEWLEQALGLDPTDANDYFKASLSPQDPDTLQLTWPNGPGVTFTVESSDTLEEPWEAGPVYEGSVSPPVLSHPIATTGARRFFRLKGEPKP